MNQTSRNQGWAITAAAGIAALLFVIGILNGSYLALAIPVAILTLFALGLVAWVGYTIATIQVEADIALASGEDEPTDESGAVTKSADDAASNAA
ncbi:MAG: hypothetical protein NXI30_21685 [bacterium]|nr:hypothetical protein [bacterium]